MRISFNFIKEFLETDKTPSELAELLTMSGMEVEHIEKLDNDWAFDIEVTSNRYDWLSAIGVANEAAACLHKKIKIEYPEVFKKPILAERKVIIEDTKDCPVYIGRSIKNVMISSSPKLLADKVSACGINSISNAVDITNYCMLKWGNPLHAFDEDKIEGNVYVRRHEKVKSF